MKEIDEKDLVEITGGGIGDKLLNIELEKPSDGADDGGSGGPGLRDGASDGTGAGHTGTDTSGNSSGGSSNIQ